MPRPPWNRRSRNKTEAGPRIKTLDEVALIWSRGEFIYLYEQVKHPTFIVCMTFETVARALANGNLRVALDRVTKKPYTSRSSSKEGDAE